METENLGGRPSEYTQKIYDIALAYLDNFNTKHNHRIPSVVGLCKILKQGSSTLYNWANSEHHLYHEEFSYIMGMIKDYQHFELVDQGLGKKFDSSVARLILYKHGYSEKKETELSGKGGGPIESKTLQVIGVEPEHTSSEQAVTTDTA